MAAKAKGCLVLNGRLHWTEEAGIDHASTATARKRRSEAGSSSGMAGVAGGVGVQPGEFVRVGTAREVAWSRAASWNAGP
jgi:hypothetical protein